MKATPQNLLLYMGEEESGKLFLSMKYLPEK